MTKKIDENQKEKTLLGTLRDLNVGEHVTVSASRESYLRRICSSYGFEWNRKFRTLLSREARTITATRIR